MPMVTTKRWELVHEWVSEHWKEGWTNERMQNELDSLDEFRAENFPSMSLKKMVETILTNGIVRKGNVEFNFSNLKAVFGTWIHFTTNCEDYGRIWVAQDESYLACLVDEHRKCNGENKQCKEYKPMINCKSLEELISEEKVQFD
jgi:hypothetical protein